MNAARIAGGLAWEAFDSRGAPTVAFELRLESGATGRVVVPAGASKGRYEAMELRDAAPRFGGLGVRGAVANVNSVLLPALIEKRPSTQAAVDAMLLELDGTPTLGRLGANSVLAVSLAWACATAQDRGIELYALLAGEAEPLLPLPMINILSGGAHAGNALDIQDVLAVPLVATSFSQAIEHVWRVRQHAVEIAASMGAPTSLVADEGGLGLSLSTNREALELVTEAIRGAGFEPGVDVGIAVDVAANQLQTEGAYRLATECRSLTASALIEELADWCRHFAIVSIEDPLADDDWPGWETATKTLGAVQLIGDDLFATNPQRLRRGIDCGIANAVLIKPNQAGCLTLASEVSDRARDAGYARIVSARSGDTEDTWLADLAVGWRADQIKVGSLARSERTAKWNRLLLIEAREGDRARYAGTASLHGPP
jgi:enolase